MTWLPTFYWREPGYHETLDLGLNTDWVWSVLHVEWLDCGFTLFAKPLRARF